MSTEDFESSGDITRLIEDLAPDVSWVDDLPIPTLDEIRARVNKFSPEERAEAEREVLRVELGNAAFEVAKGYLEHNDIDSAERWLAIADEYHVPEAKEVKEWVKSIVTLRNCAHKDIGENGDDFDFGQLIGAGVATCLLAISDSAQIEINELLYSTLAEIAKTLDRRRCDTEGRTPLLSSADLVKVDNRTGQERPKPIELLWLLHDWLAPLHEWLVPVANFPACKDDLNPVLARQQTTALSNVVFPLLFQNASEADGLTGCTFRVYLFQSRSLANTHWFSIDLYTDIRPGKETPDLLEVAVKRRALTGSASWSKRSRRLLVALPNASREHSSSVNATMLTALFEYVIPEYNLTVPQVKRLAGEMVQDVMTGRPKDNFLPLPPTLVDSSVNPLSNCASTYAAIRLIMGGNRQFWSWDSEQIDTKEDPVGNGEQTCGRVEFPWGQSQPECQRRGDSGDLLANSNEATVGIDRRDLLWKSIRDLKSKSISLNEALRKLEETGDNYLLFDDIDSGQPTVVYRGVDAKHGGVMRLAEPVTEPGSYEFQMLSSSVVAQQPLYRDNSTDEMEIHEESSTSEVCDEEKSDKFDEFLIIQCGSNTP